MEGRTHLTLKKLKSEKDDNEDDKVGNIRYSRKSSGTSSGTSSMTIDEEKESYAYLIITPSPIKGNYIQAQGGVEVEGETDYGKGQPVHYVKIGLQQELAKRVDSYDTHTPSSKLPCERPELILLNRSVWFRHLQFEEKIPHGDKLKALGKTKSNFQKGSSSALYLEHMLLRPNYPRDYYSQEWFAIKSHTAELQNLCEELDKEKPDKRRGKGVVYFEDDTTKEKKKVNTYSNEDTCIAAFKDYAPNVFKKQTGS